MLSSEYGWLSAEVLGCTLFQIRLYTRAISERLSQQNRVMAVIVRNAQMDKRDFEKFLRTLEPAISEPEQQLRQPATSQSVPTGFAYTDRSLGDASKK